MRPRAQGAFRQDRHDKARPWNISDAKTDAKNKDKKTLTPRTFRQNKVLSRQDKVLPKQEKTREEKTRHDTRRHDTIRQDKTKQDKTTERPHKDHIKTTERQSNNQDNTKTTPRQQ
jgi:hypothetical protein